MSEMLLHIAQFFSESMIIVIALLLLLTGALVLVAKSKKKPGYLKVNILNEHYQNLKSDLEEMILEKSDLKKNKKLIKRKEKSQKKADVAERKKNIFVLDFSGDIKASAVSRLREEINALLMVATPDDQVLLRLESPGGVVHGYGLAASQLQRIRNARIPLFVAVDKVAASGGYMMACVADRILSAPFSIIGSIGVVVQLPNFHRFLEKHDVDFEQITAGAYKRTLTVFGQNTESGREKMQQEVNQAHDLFKEFIMSHRQNLDMQKVATGEYWFAIKAKELGLVDELITSDDYLMKQSQRAKLIHVQFVENKKMGARLMALGQSALDKIHATSWV